MSSSRTLLFLILVAGVALAACSTPAERETRALKRGDEYFAAENWEKARVEYRNALQAVPNDGVARLRNGLVLEKLGQPREAAQFYLGAIEVRPELVDARVRLARLYLVGGAADRSMELVREGLEKSPDDASLLGMRAALKARSKDLDGALADGEAAVAQTPQDEYAIAVLAGIYSARKQPEKARELLERTTATVPGTIDLRLALAQLEMSDGHLPRAEALLREVVTLKPADPTHRLRLARFFASQGRAGDAEKVLADARKALPKDAELRAAMIEFLATNRGRAAAEAELKRMVAAEPGASDVKLTLATFYARNKEGAKAEAILQEMIKAEGSRPGGLVARSRLAALRIGAGDTAMANRLVGEVLEKSPRDTDALVLRGDLRLGAGDAKGAIEDLRAASRDLPNASPVLRALARAHLRNGEPALAEETLRRAIDADATDARARADLVEFLQQQGRASEAVDLLRETGKLFPADLVVQSAVLKAGLTARDYEMAGAAVRAVQALPGERGRAAVFAGLLAEAQGHDDEAFRDYRDALDISPQIPDALARATKLLVARKRPGDALKLFDEIAAKVPGDPIPLNLKGDQLLAARDFAGAEAAYRGAVQRAPRWWLPQRGLAYVALGRGDAQAAIRALEEAAPKVDSGWRLQAAAAQLLELSNHADEAIALYDKALAGAGTDAEGLGAANNLAMLLVTHRQDAASLKRAEQLTLAFASAGNPLVLDTYGWVRYRNGDVPGALTALERAVAIDGKLPVLQYHLGVVQEAAGQPDQALTSLQLAVRSGQTFAGLQDAADRLDRLKKVSR